MNATDARIILELLLDGVHPVTGEIFDDDHVCMQHHVVRALRTAIAALRDDELENAAQKRKKLYAGRAWNEADDRLLRILHAENRSMEEMCRRLQRRPRGIRKRLFRLKLVAPVAKPERAGTAWSSDDEYRLREMFDMKMTYKEIAAELRRTPFAVIKRLEKLGLVMPMYIDDEEDIEIPWTVEKKNLLEEMAKSGVDIALIAERFNSTEKNIKIRMFYMGLGGEAPKLFPKRDD